MFICIKQHLSNIWSSIHEKVMQHLGWVEKKRCLYKKSVQHRISFPFYVVHHENKHSCNKTNEMMNIVFIIKKKSFFYYCFYYFYY